LNQPLITFIRVTKDYHYPEWGTLLIFLKSWVWKRIAMLGKGTGNLKSQVPLTFRPLQLDGNNIKEKDMFHAWYLASLLTLRIKKFYLPSHQIIFSWSFRILIQRDQLCILGLGLLQATFTFSLLFGLTCGEMICRIRNADVNIKRGNNQSEKFQTFCYRKL